MQDLHGAAAERLEQLQEAGRRGPLEPDWLVRQLTTALRDLARAEPDADLVQELREDY